MILDDVVTFLKKVPPFQFLEEAELRKAASAMALQFFPKGHVIRRQDSEPSETLHIIKKGAVKLSIRAEDGTENLLDYRGEGETFGSLSILSKERIRSDVIAAEDTICYELPKEVLLQFFGSHPAFTEYFIKFNITKYLDRTYREMQGKAAFYGGSDRLLFSTKAGDLVARKVVSVSQGSSIRDAAQVMTDNKISSVVVLDAEGRPAGILTDRDLRIKVVLTGKSSGDPVSDVMNPEYATVDPEDYCFEALLKMLRRGLNHVLVMHDGVVRGVLTNHDFVVLQGTSPLSLTKDIESQTSLEALVPASAKVNGMIGLLLKQGAKAGNITRALTEINDRLVCKVLELAEAKLGKPPIPYCWIALGSEGRKEQTFKTDQDNALIYLDPTTPQAEKEAREYFSVFTTEVTNGLIQCGFPKCPAGYMASNPAWCRPLGLWKRTFAEWMSKPTADAIMHSLVLFDFRPIYGEFSMAERLRNTLSRSVVDQPRFLGHLANMASKNSPPVGFMRSFVVEKSGEHKNQLNMKIKGLAPITDFVRLFSLEKGISETSTIERLDALRPVHSIAREYAEDIRQSFEFLMHVRIQHQFEQMQAGQSPDNFINPNKLSNLERQSAKEAFSLISEIQALVIERYKSFIW